MYVHSFTAWEMISLFTKSNIGITAYKTDKKH